jgi:hypothetical protein
MAKKEKNRAALFEVFVHFPLPVFFAYKIVFFIIRKRSTRTKKGKRVLSHLSLPRASQSAALETAGTCSPVKTYSVTSL